jgi:isopenicillin N synthase-like dioxygenase
MMRWSNDTLKSTLHRVRAPPQLEGETVTRERFSIPYFLSADPDKVIDALPGTYGPDRPKRYEPITSGEYLNMRLNATYVGA